MRERAHSSRLTSSTRLSRARRPVDTCDWRTCVRPLVLKKLVEQTRHLRWSRQLVDLLLEELHISDDFDRLIGPTAGLRSSRYPQLLAIALVLRHSWCPQELARIVRKLRLPARLSEANHNNHDCAAALSAAASPSVRRAQRDERPRA